MIEGDKEDGLMKEDLIMVVLNNAMNNDKAEGIMYVLNNAMNNDKEDGLM
jgi:hypothetical protein